MIERDMRLPVARWLLERGYLPTVEVGSLNNCDVVGFKLTEKPFRLHEVVAVELKLRDVNGVIRQCQHHLPKVTETWAAMWRVTAKTVLRFQAAGIGLIQIDGDSLKVLVPCVPRVVPVERWKRVAVNRRKEHLWRMKTPQMLHWISARLPDPNEVVR